MPALRLLLPFMFGVGLYIAAPFNALWFVLFAFVLLVMGVVALVYVNRLAAVAAIYRWRYISGFCVVTVMLELGYTLTFFYTDTNNPKHLLHIDSAFTGKGTIYTATVAEPPVVRDKVISVLMQLRQVTRHDTAITASGNIAVSIVKDSNSQQITYGDEIVFTADALPYDEPKNPNQFNYKAYQNIHHIYQKAYVAPGQWHIARRGGGNKLLSNIYRLRAYFLLLIMQSVNGPDELAVATAIMLGYRDYINDGVMQAYSGSGVLHVLSVSGLHVAVLYFVINFLLGWMDKRPRLKLVKCVLLIFIMLLYAGLTGLSAPVLRSVWMFSLVIIAGLLDRDVSIYNVLAVSCFILLLWDPYNLADVGFQLSYIAVVGIVYLYPHIYGLVKLPRLTFKGYFGFAGRAVNYLLRFSWGLISVSIAAQIATLPLSLYYFHTFPNYFLLSNLLVIPLSNAVLIAGMALFVVGWNHWLLWVAGSVFNHLLILLNGIVFGVGSMPFSLTRGLTISYFEMVMLYAVIGVFCWFIASKRAAVLITALSCLLILSTAFSVHKIQQQNVKKLVVYDVPNMRAVSFIINQHVYYDIDTALLNNPILIRNNIRGNWWACGAESEQSIDSADFAYKTTYGKVLVVNGKRILLIENVLPEDKPPKLKVDVVILSHNAKVLVGDIQTRIKFDELVFDSSNSPAHIKHWKEDCDNFKLKYHNCREQAFEMQL